jgi:site-specific recombinase
LPPLGQENRLKEIFSVFFETKLDESWLEAQHLKQLFLPLDVWYKQSKGGKL